MDDLFSAEDRTKVLNNMLFSATAASEFLVKESTKPLSDAVKAATIAANPGIDPDILIHRFDSDVKPAMDYIANLLSKLVVYWVSTMFNEDGIHFARIGATLEDLLNRFSKTHPSG